MKKLFRILVATVTCVVAVGAATAQDFSSKPITILTPSPPGAQGDLFPRAIGQVLEKSLNTPVIIENKVGAVGVVSNLALIEAPADGHTLGLAAMSTMLIAPMMAKEPFYDPIKDFTPITVIQRGQTLLVVNPSLPVNSLQELIDYAKEKPGELVFAVDVLGSTQQLIVEAIEEKTGAEFNTVPYSGIQNAFAAVIANEAQISIINVLSAVPQIDAGKVKPLAVYAANAMEEPYKVPSIGRALGIPEIEHDFWIALIGPANMDPAIVNKLNEEITAAMQTDVLQDMLSKNAQTFEPGTPEEFKAMVEAQVEEFRPMTEHVKALMK